MAISSRNSSAGRHTKQQSRYVAKHHNQPTAPPATEGGNTRAQARAAEKANLAARRQELLSGLTAEDKREMTSFLGSVNSKTRNTLQEVTGLLPSSGQDPRFLTKKVLVHALAHLDVHRCISFLETMARLGQGATLQMLWLYERYSVPNAGGGMTKYKADHCGREMGAGKMDEIFDMSEEEIRTLLLQLADWDSVRRVKVMRAWEATDPAMTASFLLELIREEQARGNGAGKVLQCSVCPVKREVERAARMKRGEHRRKDRTIDAASLYDYHSGSRGGIIMYHSPHESFFEFKPQDGQSREMVADEDVVRDGHIRPTVRGRDSRSHTTNSALPAGQDLTERTKRKVDVSMVVNVGASTQPPSVVTYAGRSFDPRRMCGTCTEELRRAIISSGHDLEIWHTVDHERRALLTRQRQHDLSKARWAERERQDRQGSGGIHCSEHQRVGLHGRSPCSTRQRGGDRQSLWNPSVGTGQAAQVRRMLDLKLSNQNAVQAGATKDEGLKRLNEREATAWAAKLSLLPSPSASDPSSSPTSTCTDRGFRRSRLKASLNMDRHYASLEPGGLPASLRRRHKMSTKPSDFLDDGTPATPQGAKQAFGRADFPDDDETEDVRLWKNGAMKAEELLHRRRELREWQSLYGGRTRFSYLCGRWVEAAADIEEKQRQKRMIEAEQRQRRLKERQAAKLKRKLQLAELRARAGSRATGEARRRVEKDKETEHRRRLEGEELERMRAEEKAQMAEGDRYWGLAIEMQRLRAIEEERRVAWEKRIRGTREKMVAVRCISTLSDFSHAIPPRDPELAQKIERIAAM